MARINSASQRADLLPCAFAYNAPWAPVIGACAIVVAPPADHPVFARRAATDTEPRSPKRQRDQADDARILARERLIAPAIAAFKIFFMHAFERA